MELFLTPPGGFLQACLLFLLAERPAHGYGLLGRLKEFGLGDTDVGGMYRILNRFEHDGLVTSSWETGGTGPARKEYRVTPAGVESLRCWAKAIAQNRCFIDRFISRCRKVFGS